MSNVVRETLSVWPSLANKVYVPRTKEEYEKLVKLLDEITDEVGQSEDHPLASLMDVIGVLIERYEDEHVVGLTSPDD